MKATAVGKPLPQDRQLAVVRFDGEGKTLWAGDLDAGVRRWAVKDDGLTPLPTLKGHDGWVQALAVRGDGTAFSGDSWGRLIAWRDGKPLWNVVGHESWVRKVAVAPDGKTVASADSEGRVRLWDPETGKRKGEIVHGVDVLALAYAGDGTLLWGDLKGVVVRHGGAKEVRRYVTAGLYKLDRIQDVGGVRSLALSPDSKTLAVAGSKVTTGGFVQGAAQVTCFDADSGKATQTLAFGGDNEGYVLDLVWHPSGVLIGVTSGQPGSGRLFFHKPEEEAPSFSASVANAHSLALHPDGKRLVTFATTRLGGNGRGTGKDYPGNVTPLSVWRVG